MGVPVIGCGCATCQSNDPKNSRTRVSIALGLPEGNLLIDTPPELRIQLAREQIGVVHAVLFTHAHADHLNGLDDLRVFPAYTGQPVPLYCEPLVEQRIRVAFDYCFLPPHKVHTRGAVPQLEFHSIGVEPFTLLGTKIVPIRLKHGKLDVLGFRIGNVAYCTDTHEIPPESWASLQDLDVLILDCVRPEPHPTHLHLDAAVRIAQTVGARRTIFTHMSCKLEHHATNASLPAGMELAYDGMRVLL